MQTLVMTPRERLISTAAALFYEKGITGVGITEIIRDSHIAKQSLYNMFGSKEALILAVLKNLLNLRREEINTAFSTQPNKEKRIVGFFEIAKNAFEDNRFRGCMFINSALQTSNPESAVHKFVRAHKCWIKDQIKQCIFPNLPEGQSEAKAQQILMLWDGAISESYIQQSVLPIKYGMQSATDIVAASQDSVHAL